jgi:hypothetical protein
LSRRSQICAISHLERLEDYERGSCRDHIHLSRAEVRQLERKSLIVWRLPAKCVTVLPIRTGPDQYASLCTAQNTGISNQVGEELAMAIYRRQGWAEVMFALIKQELGAVA